MLPADGESFEGTRRCLGLPERVVPPTVDGVVSRNGARVTISRGNAPVRAGRRVQLLDVVAAPAVDGATSGKGARETATQSD